MHDHQDRFQATLATMKTNYPTVFQLYPTLHTWHTWHEQGLEEQAAEFDRLEEHLRTCSLRDVNPLRAEWAADEHRVIYPGSYGSMYSGECFYANRAFNAQSELRQTGIPGRFFGWRLADLDKSKARTRVEKYVQDFKAHREKGEGLLIAGGTGTGKTTMTAALVGDLILKRTVRDEEFVGHIGIRFVTIADLLNAAKDFENKRDYFDKLTRAALLVIDDLGCVRLTEFAADELAGLFDHRYRELLPLIITTNLSKKDLAAYLGDRAVSRLEECCINVVLTGADRRKKKG